MSGVGAWELFVAIMAIVGFCITLWKFFEHRIEKARVDSIKRADEAHTVATQARHDLAAYKTHVAETFVSKLGLSETRTEIMGGIRDVTAGLAHLSARIDAIMDGRRNDR